MSLVDQYMDGLLNRHLDAIDASEEPHSDNPACWTCQYPARSIYHKKCDRCLIKKQAEINELREW